MQDEKIIPISCYKSSNQLLQSVVLFVFFWFCVFPISAVELPPIVKQKLQQSGIPESAMGVFVQEIGAFKPLLAINADAAMNPASVMKLLTTFAGLELLGPAHTWSTSVYAQGALADGILQGDLVIKGYGDPRLDLENFWLLIHHLRQTGLHEIRGNLILDHSHYDIPGDDPGTFDGQPYRTYNVIPEALLVNYRTSTLHLFPQPEKNTVSVVVDPLPQSLRIINDLKLTHGVCGDWQNSLVIDVHADEQLSNDFTVSLRGNFSKQCGKQSYMLSLQDSTRYTRDLFRRLWTQQGGSFHGDAVLGSVSAASIPLLNHQSPPLADVVRGINKFSNNIAARQLYLALGVGKNPPPHSSATLDRSDHALKQWLTAKQLRFPELIIENGSGLSRKEQISAGHMGQLLLAAYASPVMPEFVSSLPIAGVDGTLKNRFGETPIKGMAHLKTGALNNVRALAGYLLDKKKRRIVIVFFVNHEHANQAREAMDRLVHWVYDRH